MGVKANRFILLYAVAIVVGGALLAPWAYWLVHPHRPDWLFRRIFDRTLLIVALVGLWPLLRSLEIRSWADLGLPRQSNWWRAGGIGLLIGIVSLASGGVILLLTGQRSMAGVAAPMRILGALVTGLVVGVVEEILFRAGIFGALRRVLPFWSAVLISSAIYSVVHFLKPKEIRLGTITWWSGFDNLAQVVAHSFQAPGALIGVVTLILAGCILAVAFARTRALYLSIGIHAGWVFALKTFSLLTDAGTPRQWWGGSSLVDNLLVWPVLLVLLMVLARWSPRAGMVQPGA